MPIKTNIEAIRQRLKTKVTLVCVSKFHPDEDVMEAYNAGERVFGESKVQELSGKYERLPKDIHWHFIGHLQSNKVKYIIPFVDLIHGVDSLKLLSVIDKQAFNSGRIVDCLLQVHIAKEETKFGFSADEVKTAIQEAAKFKNVKIRGLMGMATFTENKSQVKNEFHSLKLLFEELQPLAGADFSILSMGMSDDFELAVEEGSTMVRVGSSIFGQRNYG